MPSKPLQMRMPTYLFLLAFAYHNTFANAAPLNLPEWLDPLMPVKGVSLRDEIRCYSLPYGGIGFLSHILTYWVILILGFGRRPYWPWSKLSAGKFDLCLALAQLIISVLIAAFTISRCRSRWQFVLIAVWKLVLSVEVGIWGVSAAMKARKVHKQEKGYQPVNVYIKIHCIWSRDAITPWTLLFYAAGYAVGMVGLLAVVWNLRHEYLIKLITYVFAAVTFSIIGVCIMLGCCCRCADGISGSKLLLAMVFSTLMVGALYSDWILGDIAGSLMGVPAGDPAYLYWVRHI